MKLLTIASSASCLVVGTASCSAFIDFPTDPVLVEPTDERWGCLGQGFEVGTPSSTIANVRVAACNFVTNCANAVSGLTVSVCNKRDVGCTNPVTSGVRDVDGTIDVQVPTPAGGFDGYLKITSTPALCTDTSVFGSEAPNLCNLVPQCNPAEPDDSCLVPTIAPALLFFNPPIVRDSETPIPLPLIPSAALPLIVTAAGAELDPTTGNLFITAMDCRGKPAEGVTYAIGQATESVTQLYVDKGVVSDTVFQTDESGIGGFVGVPPGFAEVTGFTPDGRRVGKIGVQAAPFTLTYSALIAEE